MRKAELKEQSPVGPLVFDKNDLAILKDVSTIIKQAMMRIHQFNPKNTGLSAKGLELSLTDLVNTAAVSM